MNSELEKKNYYVLGYLFLGVLAIILLINFFRNGIFREDLGLNLLVIGDKNVGVLVVRPRESMVTWFVLPDNLKIKIWKTGAVYSASSLWQLSETESDRFGFVGKSFGYTTGISVPRLLKLNGELSPEVVNSQLLSFGIMTDLSWRDRLLVRKYLSESLVSKKIMEITSPNQAYREDIEPDGKSFLIPEGVFQSWAKNKFVYEQILAEELDIEVVNRSKQVGMGFNLANLLELSGAHVVDVRQENGAEKETEGCFYFSKTDDFSFVDELLKSHLDCTRSKTSNGMEMESDYLVWYR